MNTIGCIKAIIILSFDGRRVLAKYYSEKLNSEQFEKRLFSKSKTQKSKDEIIVLDGLLIVHKCISGSHIYVVGGRNDNPLILDCVLNCLAEVINSLPNGERTGNIVLDNLSRVISALDEICDHGLILEVDPKLVMERIEPTQDTSSGSMTDTARRLFGFSL